MATSKSFPCSGTIQLCNGDKDALGRTVIEITAACNPAIKLSDMGVQDVITGSIDVSTKSPIANSEEHLGVPMGCINVIAYYTRFTGKSISDAKSRVLLTPAYKMVTRGKRKGEFDVDDAQIAKLRKVMVPMVREMLANTDAVHDMPFTGKYHERDLNAGKRAYLTGQVKLSLTPEQLDSSLDEDL